MYQNLFFGAGAGRNRAFRGGAGTGADIFYLDPESKKKISGAGAEEKWQWQERKKGVGMELNTVKHILSICIFIYRRTRPSLNFTITWSLLCLLISVEN